MSNKEALFGALVVFGIILFAFAIFTLLVVLDNYISIWILVPLVVFALSFTVFKFMKY